MERDLPSMQCIVEEEITEEKEGDSLDRELNAHVSDQLVAYAKQNEEVTNLGQKEASGGPTDESTVAEDTPAQVTLVQDLTTDETSTRSLLNLLKIEESQGGPGVSSSTAIGFSFVRRKWPPWSLAINSPGILVEDILDELAAELKEPGIAAMVFEAHAQETEREKLLRRSEPEGNEVLRAFEQEVGGVEIVPRVSAI
ncbi:hypothetical protein RHSIM_Rhsim10G0124800 [Rhododendron simsii]|uniref:Uncharacterized protein n=1 Tax=Rhododendron simsii TaxID=118357 RepID=A0A834L992_RHOSS|nr:hypothetical protein RHSIM_Rhsim10G0124800 [Rhododendron simsii]